MSEPRKKWQEAKSKVTEKGWESKVKFQSDLGPDMDTMGALLTDVFNHLAALTVKAEKAEQLAKKVGKTASDYRSTIGSAKLSDADKKTLSAGLAEAMKLSRNAATNVRDRAAKVHKSVDFAILALLA